MLPRLAVVLPPLLLAGCAGTDVEPPPAPRALEPEVRRLATGMGFVEGPVWRADERAVVFSDIPGGKRMRWSEADGLTVLRDVPNSNGNALDGDGRLLSCQHGARNIVREEDDGTTAVLIDRFEGRRLNSPNDLAVQSDGVIWFTDPPWGLANQREGRELPGNWVFRLDPGTGDLRAVLTDRAMPNGIVLSEDETTLYVSDTGGHPSHPDPAFHDLPATVSAYALSDGELVSTDPLWRTEIRSDGMCMLAAYVVTTGPKGLACLAPDGEHVLDIPLPEAPANVCVGGEDGDVLFVTARTSLYAVEPIDDALIESLARRADRAMNVHITTHTPDLARSEAFFESLGFTRVSQTPVVYAAGGAAVEIDPTPTARQGIKVRLADPKALGEELASFGPVHELPDGGGSLVAAPSGTWVYLVPDGSDAPADAEPSILGNYMGVSLETTRFEDSIRFWETLGLKVAHGGADQGWVALTHEGSGFGVSLMKPLACPHSFVNPSLTYFNSGKNPEVIAEIRKRGIPIHEEVTAFNPKGEVDNVILREPGGVGFFVFND